MHVYEKSNIAVYVRAKDPWPKIFFMKSQKKCIQEHNDIFFSVYSAII